jgi:Zn finger protein HypA/HybF involved in hydrogenase expression
VPNSNGVSKSLNEMKTHTTIGVPSEILDLIRDFPVERQVEHCGQRFSVPSLDFYARCPRCGSQIKVRAYSAAAEIEDLFDAVLQWMRQEGAKEAVRRRQAELDADSEE